MHLCGGGGLLTGADPEEHQRLLQKKQKNRVSAQRSRRKHTVKADALHQQHESLEKHNQALRKEIRALQSELAQWRRTLHLHECLCLTDCASCLAPLPLGCWGAKWPLEPTPHRLHGCQQQPGLSQSPASSSSAQPTLSPDPKSHGSPGLLLSPLPLLTLGSVAITAPTAQLSCSPVQSALPSDSSLLRPSSKLKAPLPSFSAQPAPQQPLGPDHLTKEKLASSPHSSSTAPGLACLQDTDKPAFCAAGQQGLGVDLNSHPLLAFPLLSSAQVHF